MTVDNLERHTPSKWTLIEHQEGEQCIEPRRAVWQYNPRPQLTVRVGTRTDSEAGDPDYCVQKVATIATTHYTASRSGFLPHVAVAERVMRGVDGVSGDAIHIRLGVQTTIAVTLSKQIRTWEDFITLHNEWNGDFTRIDGVGPTTNQRITAAVAAGVFDRNPIEAVRNPDEGDDETHAVYVLVPALHEDASLGWRVRKEWRDASDGRLCSSVMLPTEHSIGDIHATQEKAQAFAQEIAAERVAQTSDNDGTESVENGQADLTRWSE